MKIQTQMKTNTLIMAVTGVGDRAAAAQYGEPGQEQHQWQK